jgi:hypothetical protein
MEATSTSETSVNFYQATRRNIREDNHSRLIFCLHQQRPRRGGGGEVWGMWANYSAFTDKVECNCHFTAGTAWLTAKRCKVFPIRVKYRSIKTVKSTYLFYSSFCREPGSDSCVQLCQWTHCSINLGYTRTNITHAPADWSPETEPHIVGCSVCLVAELGAVAGGIYKHKETREY